MVTIDKKLLPQGTEPLMLYRTVFKSGDEVDSDLLKMYAVLGVLLKEKDMYIENKEHASLLLSAMASDSSGVHVNEEDVEQFIDTGLVNIDSGKAVMSEKADYVLNSLKYVWRDIPQKMRELHVSKYYQSASVREINKRKIESDTDIIARLLTTDKKYYFIPTIPVESGILDIEEKGYVELKSNLHIRRKKKERGLPYPLPYEICSEILDKHRNITQRLTVKLDDETRKRMLAHGSHWFKIYDLEATLTKVMISRGKKFWQGVAEYLMKNNFKEADLRITEKELGLIREHYPDFNKESSIEVCPIDLPKEECAREWKTTDSMAFFAHADMGNARFLLHAVVPGVYVKPLGKEEKKVYISVDDFKNIVETVQRMEYDLDKHFRVSTLGRSRIKRYKDTILIDLSNISDRNLKRGKYIRWDVLKEVYDRLP